MFVKCFLMFFVNFFIFLQKNAKQTGLFVQLLRFVLDII